MGVIGGAGLLVGSYSRWPWPWRIAAFRLDMLTIARVEQRGTSSLSMGVGVGRGEGCGGGGSGGSEGRSQTGTCLKFREIGPSVGGAVPKV